MIAAIGENRELGKKGDLCFRLPGDLKYFKKTTMGYPIFMGLTTWYSLPGKLPGREHYIAVFKKEDLPEDLHQVEDIFAFAEEWKKKDETIFVTGGASMYRQMLPYADKMYLTEVHANDPDADVFFPEFDAALWNRAVLGSGSDNGIHYDFVCYTRK